MREIERGEDWEREGEKRLRGQRERERETGRERRKNRLSILT